MDGLLPTGRHQVSNTGTYIHCVFIAHRDYKSIQVSLLWYNACNAGSCIQEHSGVMSYMNMNFIYLAF